MSSSDSPSTAPAQPPPPGFHYKYTVQKGFFMQSEDETDDSEFDFRNHNFGLISRSYPIDEDASEFQWRRFENYVRSLEATKQPNESYKVLFLGRHGEGWHNVAEAKYGTKAWDCYYSALDGADGLTWADAHLTSVGELQAKDVADLWAQQLNEGIPVPETFYVSPLTRTIQTADISFSTLPFPHPPSQKPPYRPLIKELLREALGVHTCDRRSTLTHLRATYPHLTFESGFSDQDLLWKADYREPASARRYRLGVFLDGVVAEDEGVLLSMTSHSGAIGSLLEVMGHRKFRLETGGVIPVFIKAERVESHREIPPKEPSDSPPLCKDPPAPL
ncbi:phosphoglycerate mutase family protein [Pyrenophora tritici-repentis]|uniref:Phosphoglycerate mutase family protein n=2 Tax=Pyrenophora tritici-repentis TaxID=45151 RepID=A0A2W1GLN0_9PLEO|nr:phosphoglycerate mutase family protein [Pyrenophora tritici-repentis Pt-1C-BFP]KAA8623252.1 Phosphoglycerate mutase family protein [Pyrenophora tritici-repentis]EDU45207.1 phosphoglycerate mutase family protein [Pyrenophora tritici-repentis Pt-1C-BFP]KAF7452249.1 Phosphoglycerate mutase family protein [Pyrenophora tritici-repentis]KAF7574628.1 phosphoglycerate mutase family protein [Pyrenophora tritici-repentis]KAG9386592.1 Phosphoglycerate mutase family protein [Pyrenophora tritici-repenti